MVVLQNKMENPYNGPSAIMVKVNPVGQDGQNGPVGQDGQNGPVGQDGPVWLGRMGRLGWGGWAGWAELLSSRLTIIL